MTTQPIYSDLNLALARYNTMSDRQHMTRGVRQTAKLPAAAWLGIGERLICAALCAHSLNGDSLQFIVDRANDALLNGGWTGKLWRPNPRT